MPSDDRLDRGGLVKRLTSIIASSRRDDESQVVALVGPWGSGKTWILDEVTPYLNGITRDFNPWLFSDELGVFKGFAVLLLERVQDKKARKRIAKALDIVGPSVKGFGFDLSGSISRASEALRDLNSPEAIRTEIAKALGTEPKTAYVVIDDLDRLTPSELLTVFKLLRLVGDLPGFVYILAYDEETVLRLMMRTDIAFDSMERARSYLDKIVATKLQIPPLPDSTKERLVLEPLVAFGRESQRHLTEGAIQEFTWRLTTLVLPRLTNIRLCARYVREVQELPPSLYGEVRFLDWALISFLRTVEPHALAVVQKYPWVFLGRALGFSLGNEEKFEEAKRVASELVAEASTESHRLEILNVVDHLFPDFQMHRQGKEPSHRNPDQGVDSADYFQLYFEHSMPSTVVSDVAVEQALLSLMGSPDEATDAGELLALIEENPAGVLFSIQRRWQLVSTEPKKLFTFLSVLWPSPTLNYTWGIFQTSGQAHVRLLAEDLLRSFQLDELESLLPSIIESRGADSLLNEILQGIGSPAGSQFFVDWAARARKLLAEVCFEQLSGSTSPIDGVSRHAFQTLRRLSKTMARDAMKDMLRSERARPVELVALVLRYHTEFGGHVSAIGVADDVLADKELVDLLIDDEPHPYPGSWDDPGSFESAINASPPPDSEVVASYVLAGWAERAQIDSSHNAD